MPKVDLSKKQQDKIIKQFMADYDLAFTAESRNRIEQVEDLRFAALDQWADDVKQQRQKRPMLTLDRIGQSVRKVLGGIRQNMPSIKADPVDDGADKDTAAVYEDLIRQIEQGSNARQAYLHAAKTQVKCGYGVWRVNTRMNSDDVFEQDIVVEPIENPFTAYSDPDAVHPQRQDGRFWIISDMMSKDKYEAEFGKKIPTSISNQGIGESLERWYDSDSIRIGEYFVKSKKKTAITQLSNGVVVYDDEITEDDIALYQQQGITPVKSRDVERDVITWYKVSAFHVLDKKEWPSKYFPIIPVFGEVENIEGERHIRGIVRPAKDPQRMYNYWNSAAAETIALQPKAPWLVTKDQIKNYKSFWERANSDNLPYLPYEPDGKAPPPQRVAPPALQAGLLQQGAIAAEDIQQATGVFEASVGALPEQRSGRAVIALQQEADLGTSLYMDNLASSIEHTGRVIIDMIPTYYDTQRVVRLRGEDDSTRFVEINKPILTPDGVKIENDLTRGKYDVRVGVGPSYRTRRIEAANSIVELGRVFPQVMQVAGDLVAKNLDWPGADEIADRLKKLLPPGIAENDEEITPEMQAAQQQAQELQQVQLQLAMAEQQAKIENTQADTLNKQATAAKNQANAVESMTEAQQNELENAVQVAELAAQQQNAALMNQALQEVVMLVRNAGSPAPTVGIAG